MHRLPVLALLSLVGAVAAPCASHAVAGSQRLRITTVPRHPRAGDRLRIDVRGGARGRRLSLCVVSPAGPWACRETSFGPRGARVGARAPRPGRWRIEARGRGIAAARALHVRGAGRRLSVLAVGDSMMVPVARHLGRLLRRHRPRVDVAGDIHFGAGLSVPWSVDWRAEAAATAPRLRPDVVVLLLGGGEGWPFGAIECCTPSWVTEYASRAATVARAYLRRGAAQVYWLSLPAPANPLKVPALQAANGGVALGLAGLAPWARVLDLASVLTPGFVFRATMPVEDRERVVRNADGLHLNRISGTIAARMVIAALEADGVLDVRHPTRG